MLASCKSRTSASTPVFAAIVSLVNSARLRKGYGPIGWLNPLLYKYAGEFTNDISVGNNYCAAVSNDTIVICCKEGFEATAGWDPVTGLGSLNVGRMIDFLSSLQFNSTTADDSYEDEGGSDDENSDDEDGDEDCEDEMEEEDE